MQLFQIVVSLLSLFAQLFPSGWWTPVPQERDVPPPKVAPARRSEPPVLPRSAEPGFDQRALALDAERALEERDPDLACSVKNSLHNLAVPSAARWLDPEALRRIRPLSPGLDALCPHLDPVPFRRLLERARGRP